MCEVIGLVDLDSREWRFLQPDGSGAGSDHGDHIDCQLKLQEFCDARENIAAPLHRAHNALETVVQ